MLFWRAVTVILWMVGLVMIPASVNGYWMPKAIAWLLGCSVLVSLQWTHPVSRSARPTASWWMAALMAWVLAKFMMANFWPWLWMRTAQDRFFYAWSISTIFPTLTFFLSVLAWRALVQSTDTPRRWASVGWHLCCYAGVLALYGLTQLAGLDPFLHVTAATPGSIGSHVPVTVFGNPMLTAQCLAICAPLCLVFKPSWGRIVYGMSVLVIGCTHSCSALIAFVIGSSVVWIFRKQWRWMWVASALSAAIMGWMWQSHRFAAFFSESGRFEMWRTALDVWRRQPWSAWVGYQLGAVESATAHGFWNYGSLHCEPLQILFELGVIGAVLTMGVGVALLKRLMRAQKNTLLMGWMGSAVSYLVVACVGFPLRVGSLLMLGVLIVSAVESLMEEATHGYPA